jgi:acid stress-induced BolA-like protein IbaG/YrbA
MYPEDIKQIIEAGLQECTAIVETPDGTHYTATVVSSDFNGKNRVQKQQLVYAILHDYISSGTIHALSIKTFTLEEWRSQHG